MNLDHASLPTLLLNDSPLLRFRLLNDRLDYVEIRKAYQVSWTFSQ